MPASSGPTSYGSGPVAARWRPESADSERALAAPSPTASESTQNTLRFGSSHLIFNLLRFEAAMALAYAAAASAAAIETVVI